MLNVKMYLLHCSEACCQSGSVAITGSWQSADVRTHHVERQDGYAGRSPAVADVQTYHVERQDVTACTART